MVRRAFRLDVAIGFQTMSTFSIVSGPEEHSSHEDGSDASGDDSGLSIIHLDRFPASPWITRFGGNKIAALEEFSDVETEAPLITIFLN